MGRIQFKDILHRAAYVLLVLCAVMFFFASILTVVNCFMSAEMEGVPSVIQRFLSGLSIVAYPLSMIPYGGYLLTALMVVVNFWDIFWRKSRGHRFDKRRFILVICVAVISIIGSYSLGYIQWTFNILPITEVYVD